MAVGFGNWPSWLREWSQSLGVGLAMVTLASSLIAVPLSAAGQLNLADGQVTAWVMTIYTVPCVLGIVLTLHFRQPLLLTGNIFVLIFIVSLQGRVPFAELAGASLVAGAAVVAISALG
jgi:benzoate membrane transport protein